MRIEIHNKTAAVLDTVDVDGSVVAMRHEIVRAAINAIVDNGAQHIELDDAHPPDLLLVSFTLDMADDGTADCAIAMATASRMIDRVSQVARLMLSQGGGRIVLLMSAVAGLPMRRHPHVSMLMAGALAGMRTLAMQCGPSLSINAVGVGVVGDPVVAGDAAMLSHTALGRAATVQEIVACVLFFCDPENSYCTGQLLSVDGGWSAGYGRDF